MLRSSFVVICSFLLASCGEKDTYDPARDYFTFANTEQFVTRHIALDLDVDFERQVLRGSVVLNMTVLDSSADQIILDTRDIEVENVVFIRSGGDTDVATFEMGERDEVLGTPLLISVPASIDTSEEIAVRINYETSPNVMSANNDPLTPRGGEYQFDMPQPIPAYLLAIAVGNFYFAPLGDDTGVYTEPELLDASVYEFSSTQDMLDVAEEQFGPYRWGRYDLLILPPSFPFGGMENPRLSFITPSLLAGDRSLVSVIAHELAHSWSGNLVTNATWRDGWLNEGMTSYLESRLMEIIYDKDRVDEERVLGYEELLLDFDRVPLERQALAPRLESGDADSVQGTIHYHKGQLFLEYLEREFGREKFDPFILGYFDHFAFKTLTTEVFLDYLEENLLQKYEGVVSREQAEAWTYQPGLPDGAPIPSSSTLDKAAELAAAWSIGEVSMQDVPVNEWSPQALIHFINSLPADLSHEKLASLDSELGLSDTQNAEIARTWFIQVANRRFEPAYPQLEAHLNRHGRARLVTPIYGALASNGHDAELANSVFQKAKAAYHPLTNSYIERTLTRAAEKQ